MPTVILPRSAGGSAPVFTPPPLRLLTLVNRPVRARPAFGPGGHAPDAIADFLASLMEKHDSAAAIFSGDRRS